MDWRKRNRGLFFKVDKESVTEGNNVKGKSRRHKRGRKRNLEGEIEYNRTERKTDGEK